MVKVKICKNKNNLITFPQVKHKPTYFCSDYFQRFFYTFMEKKLTNIAEIQKLFFKSQYHVKVANFGDKKIG